MPCDHLVNESVQPVGKQQFVVGRFACDFDCLLRFDVRRVGDDGGERKRGLLESLFAVGTDAADADVGAVRKMLPGHAVSSRRAAATASAGP
jgi:hypothetical protein